MSSTVLLTGKRQFCTKLSMAMKTGSIAESNKENQDITKYITENGSLYLVGFRWKSFVYKLWYIGIERINIFGDGSRLVILLYISFQVANMTN